MWFKDPRAREPMGKIAVQVSRSENEEHRGQENVDVLAPTVRKRVNSTLLCLFVLVRPSTDGMLLTHIGRFKEIEC